MIPKSGYGFSERIMRHLEALQPPGRSEFVACVKCSVIFHGIRLCLDSWP
jgi:hypothetical protein